MSNKNNEFQHLLNTISDFENQRRIQQAERFRVQAKMKKLKENIAKSQEELISEEKREIDLQNETKNELKIQMGLETEFQKLKTESISQQQTNKMFENHVVESTKMSAKKREDLKSKLSDMKAKSAEYHQFWESQDSVREFRELEKEFSSKKTKNRNFEKQKSEVEKNQLLKNEVEKLQKQLNKLSEEERNKGIEIRSNFDEEEDDSHLKKEIEALTEKLNHIKNLKNDTIESVSQTFQLLEALGLAFEKKICVKCQNKDNQ